MKLYLLAASLPNKEENIDKENSGGRRVYAFLFCFRFSVSRLQLGKYAKSCALVDYSLRVPSLSNSFLEIPSSHQRMRTWQAALEQCLQHRSDNLAAQWAHFHSQKRRGAILQPVSHTLSQPVRESCSVGRQLLPAVNSSCPSGIPRSTACQNVWQMLPPGVVYYRQTQSRWQHGLPIKMSVGVFFLFFFIFLK